LLIQAIIYQDGCEEAGVQKNIHKAIGLYERAIEQNNTMAMFNLAVFYKKGLEEEGIEKNINKTIELYQKAVELDYPVKQFFLFFILFFYFFFL
jgi:TPR repeat protein